MVGGGGGGGGGAGGGGEGGDCDFGSTINMRSSAVNEIELHCFRFYWQAVHINSRIVQENLEGVNFKWYL